MPKATALLVALTFLVVVGCSGSKETTIAEAGSEPPADATFAPAPSATSEPGTRHLFLIERSKNANIVRYDARLTAEGELDPKEPVTAYWVLHAEDGRREELNWVQRQKAYGFSIKPAPSGDGYVMSLVPLPERKITVRKVEGGVRAEMLINGRRSVLEKVYIQSSPGLLLPKVHYLRVFGTDLETGEERAEKIVPGAHTTDRS